MGRTSTDCPSVSVIICHHTHRLIERCLASVSASYGVNVETIVVTSDPTYVPTDVDCYFLNDGPAAKRNLGVAHATNNTIIFLDDDVEIAPTCLFEFWKFLAEHPKCGMVFAKIYKMEEGRRDELDDCGSWLTWTGFLWNRAGNRQVDTGQFNQPTCCLASKSATCAVRRQMFLDVGGFDASYYILGEESDLAWRGWLSGWEVWYSPQSISFHAFGCESLKPKQDYYTLERIHYHGSKNYVRLLCTNLGIARLSWMLPIHVGSWGVALLGFAMRGEWHRTQNILSGIGWCFTHVETIRRKRHRVQSTRVVSDRLLFQSIAYNPGISYYVNRMWRYWTTQLHG